MTDITGAPTPPLPGDPNVGAQAAAGQQTQRAEGKSPLSAKQQHLSITAVLVLTRQLLTDLFGTLTQTLLPAMNARMQALTNAMNQLTAEMGKAKCTHCINQLQGEQQALSNMVQQLQSMESSVTSNATTFENYVVQIIDTVKNMLNAVTTQM